MAPDRFGRYEILAEVGDGSMARVYRAWDPRFGRAVAVKTVKSEHLSSDSAADYLRRFQREARAAGALSHRNTVRVFDVGPDFIVMEFVEGRTLRELLRERHRLQPEEAIRLLAPLADAIDHSHRAGIVHRDVKPANVMVQPDGSPKLMDFGIAHLEASIMTGAGEILGSPSYMAPEQVAGADVTPSWDIWALATVAYEMLTGRPPFQGPIMQVICQVTQEDPPPPRRWNPELPARYDDVFARALARLPEMRYATAGELVAALGLRWFERDRAGLSPTAWASPVPAEGAQARETSPQAITTGPGPQPPLAEPTVLARRRTGGLWSCALGLGVAGGLLLGLASSPVERDAPAAAPPETLSSDVVRTVVARAAAGLASGPILGASAVTDSEVTSAMSPDAFAFADLESEPILGASAAVTPDPSVPEAANAGAWSGLPNGPGAGLATAAVSLRH